MEYTDGDLILRVWFISLIILMIFVILFDLFNLIQALRTHKSREKIKELLGDFGSEVGLLIFGILCL